MRFLRRLRQNLPIYIVRLRIAVGQIQFIEYPDLRDNQILDGIDDALSWLFQRLNGANVTRHIDMFRPGVSFDIENRSVEVWFYTPKIEVGSFEFEDFTIPDEQMAAAMQAVAERANKAITESLDKAITEANAGPFYRVDSCCDKDV